MTAQIWAIFLTAAYLLAQQNKGRFLYLKELQHLYGDGLSLYVQNLLTKIKLIKIQIRLDLQTVFCHKPGKHAISHFMLSV